MKLKGNVKFKRVAVSSALLLNGVLAGAVLATASNGVQKIQAMLNTSITFKVDGAAWTPKDGNGNRQYALIYNGSTYLPLRSTAEALGSSVALNATTKVIDITSGSGGSSTSDTTGIPYNDINTSVNTQPSTSTATASSGILKLSGTESEMAAKLKPEAMTVLDAYVTALKTGSTAKFEAYLDAHVSGVIEDSPIRYDHNYLLKQFKESVASSLSSGTADSRAKHIAALANAKASDVRLAYTGGKDEYGDSYTFFVEPEGYSGFLSNSITFTFKVDKYGGSNYILAEVAVF
jgi:hypothetical protein